MPDIPSWHEFFAITAGIAATLSGLVFVAVSINLMQIISFPGVVTLALESLTQLLGAMAIALVGLIPGQTALMLSVETLALTFALWFVQTWWQVDFFRKQRRKHPWQWAANRFFRTQLACTAFLAAGVLLFFRRPSAMYFFVPGLLLSFVAGVANAWVLLVKIVSVSESLPAPAEAGQARAGAQGEAGLRQ